MIPSFIPSRLDRFRLDLVAIASVLMFIALIATAQSPGDATGTSTIYEGFTEPRYDIMVAASEIGRLDSVEVEVGDRVTAGTLIGQLEDELQASSLKIATHQAAMTGELEAAKAELQLNHNRVETLQQLARDDMARPDELKRAKANFDIAQGRYITVQEQLRMRELECERFQLQVERRKIRVPMSGVVAEVFHRPGEYITPANPALCRLLVMDQLYAVFNIPVEETAAMEVGTPVQVYLRSSSVTIESTIISISPSIDGESGTVQIRAELDNREGRYLVGDRCTLRVLPHRAPVKRGVRSTMRHLGTQGR